MKQSRKLMGVVLAFVFVLMIAGCGHNAENGTSSQGNNEQSSEQKIVESNTPDTSKESASNQTANTDRAEDSAENNSVSDILVVYFSRTGEQYNVGVIDKGNTAIVAEMIAEETGADTFELLPENDTYPTTYNELTDVAKQEQRDNARPAYQGNAPDMSGYSTIFICAPVWWGDWPMICYTFFEENAELLEGKTLIPLSTHEGSGLSGFDTKLSGAIPGAEVKTGLAIRGQDAQNKQDNVRESVREWLAGLGF